MKKKARAERGEATFARVKKELAEPRKANSVRRAEKLMLGRTMTGVRRKAKG